MTLIMLWLHEMKNFNCNSGTISQYVYLANAKELHMNIIQGEQHYCIATVLFVFTVHWLISFFVIYLSYHIP